MIQKNSRGCYECNELKRGEKLSFLNATHGDAHIKNLGLLKEKNMEKFISKD